MDTKTVQDEKGALWIMIVGCPWQPKHTVQGQEEGVSGPTFAECAGCEYQSGRNVEIPSGDGIASHVYPERLVCGYGAERMAQSVKRKGQVE